eukprot:scaffold1141_cov333-Pavlova_lutheri.AAC.33
MDHHRRPRPLMPTDSHHLKSLSQREGDGNPIQEPSRMHWKTGWGIEGKDRPRSRCDLRRVRWIWSGPAASTLHVLFAASRDARPGDDLPVERVPSRPSPFPSSRSDLRNPMPSRTDPMFGRESSTLSDPPRPEPRGRARPFQTCPDESWRSRPTPRRHAGRQSDARNLPLASRQSSEGRQTRDEATDGVLERSCGSPGVGSARTAQGNPAGRDDDVGVRRPAGLPHRRMGCRRVQVLERISKHHLRRKHRRQDFHHRAVAGPVPPLEVVPWKLQPRPQGLKQGEGIAVETAGSFGEQDTSTLLRPWRNLKGKIGGGWNPHKN